MTAHRREIQRQHGEVVHRLLKSHGAPCQRQEAIDEAEDDERRQDAHKAPAIELRHANTRLERNQQECRHHHEQRHASAPNTAIVECHPKAVRLVGEHRHVARKPRRIGCIEILACMHKHNHETCHHTNVVDKHYSLLLLSCHNCQK